MTAPLIAHPGTALELLRAVRRPIAALRERQPLLAAFGLGCLAFGAATATAALADPREISGASVWLKPTKFFVSTGVFALTSAVFFGFVRPERRRAPHLVMSARVLVGAATFELAYIALQAALGEASHFNKTDLLHHGLFVLMGLGAAVMLATKIPLAIEIARRPVAGLDPAWRIAIVAGMSMTVAFGLASGVAMGVVNSHAVGPESPGVPVLGWNAIGGDIRVAHFIGMHCEQVLPVAAALAGALARRRAVVLASGAALASLWVFAFAQALAGRPLPSG